MENLDRDQELQSTPDVAKKKEKKAPTTVTLTVSLWKIVLATVLMVVLLIVLAGALIYGITGKLPYDLGATATTAATQGQLTDATTPTSAPRTAEELGMTIEGIADRALYSADDDAVAAAADEVVATVGNYTLTNAQLQVFYWMEFSGFVADAQESGYDVLTDYELDVTKPLAEQTVIQSVVTWEQFFLHNALGSFWRYAALNTMADAINYEISAEDAESLAKVPEQLEEDAKAEGYESAAEMIKDRLGPGCTMEDFMYYMELASRGDLYGTQYQTEYVPTTEDLEAFYSLNAEYYEYYGITKETPKTRSVRHILLVPEGATTDESTGHITATEEQWAAGEKAAQEMLNAWVESGAKEEDFAALANEHSTDGGSNTNGGLYENVITGQMVATFNDWLFDASRQSGDYGIVKTDFGYHLMYYVSEAEEETWIAQVTKDCISSGYGLSVKLSEVMEATALDTVLDKVVLSDIKQEPVEAEATTTEPTAATE